jgi:DNA-binding MarR family transcriptional regulator
MLGMSRAFTPPLVPRLPGPPSTGSSGTTIAEPIRRGAVCLDSVTKTYGGKLRLKRQSVQRVADLLVNDGLAVYEDNPHHRRAKLLQLTPEGHSAMSKIENAHRAWADALGAEIGESKLRKASAILDTVFDTVEHLAEVSLRSTAQNASGSG